MDVRFTNLSDADRKTLIENFIGVRVYSEASEEVKAELVASWQKTRDLEAQANHLGEAVAHLNDLADTLRSKLEESTKARIDLLDEEVLRITTEKMQADMDLACAYMPDTKSLGADQAALDRIGKEIREFEAQLASTRGTLNVLGPERTKTKHLIDLGKCPTCESDISNSVTLVDKLRDLDTQMHEVKNQQRDAEETLPALNTEMLGLNQRIKQVEAKERKERSDLGSRVSQLRYQLTVKMEERKRLEEDLSTAESLLEQTLASAEEKEQAREDVLTMFAAAKRDEDVLLFWKDAFSPTGLRSLVLDKAVEFINSRLLVHSESLTAGEIKVQLSPVTQTKTVGEKSKIDILVKGSGSSYQGSSSGQKRRIDLCIQFALYDLLQSFRGASNLLVVDEMDGGLDERGVSRLVSSLSSLDRSVFLVTHNQRLRSIVSGQNVGQHLLVIREGGYSRVES
jgi:DNA repair exonuclease SbcCD ATPase subunit